MLLTYLLRRSVNMYSSFNACKYFLHFMSKIVYFTIKLIKPHANTPYLCFVREIELFKCIFYIQNKQKKSLDFPQNSMYNIIQYQE